MRTTEPSTDQRFYASTYGRFNSPDPYSGSAGPGTPASWNRYAYVLGDPINNSDRHGTHLDCDDDDCSEADCDGDPLACDIDQQKAAANVSVGTDGEGNIMFGIDVDGSDTSGGDTGSDDDSDSDPVDPEPMPTFSTTVTIPVTTASNVNSCISGSAALGAVVGGDILGPIFAGVSATGGAVGGTFAAPVVGTFAGGVAAGTIGYAGGTVLGTLVGGSVGGLLGNVFCRQGGGGGQRKGERGTTGKPDGTPNPAKHAKPDPANPGRWLTKDPHTGKWTPKLPGWKP